MKKYTYLPTLICVVIAYSGCKVHLDSSVIYKPEPIKIGQKINEKIEYNAPLIAYIKADSLVLVSFGHGKIEPFRKYALTGIKRTLRSSEGFSLKIDDTRVRFNPLAGNPCQDLDSVKSVVCDSVHLSVKPDSLVSYSHPIYSVKANYYLVDSVHVFILHDPILPRYRIMVPEYSGCEIVNWKLQ